MLTARATEALLIMRDNSEEIVADGLQVWVGDEQFSRSTLKALLRVMAITDVSDTKGMERYVINDVGDAILVRPELADEILPALLKRGAITIRDNRIEEIDNDH